MLCPSFISHECILHPPFILPSATRPAMSISPFVSVRQHIIHPSIMCSIQPSLYFSIDHIFLHPPIVYPSMSPSTYPLSIKSPSIHPSIHLTPLHHFIHVSSISPFPIFFLSSIWLRISDNSMSALSTITYVGFSFNP